MAALARSITGPNVPKHVNVGTRYALEATMTTMMPSPPGRSNRKPRPTGRSPANTVSSLVAAAEGGDQYRVTPSPRWCHPTMLMKFIVASPALTADHCRSSSAPRRHIDRTGIDKNNAAAESR